MALRKPRPLARAVLEFANAANGLRPLARKGYVTVLVFWFGWPTSEVPGIYFSASLLDALRRGRRGDFAGPRGKAALALTAASWAILGVIRYRGVTTPGPVLEAGLREQLGPDYAEGLAAYRACRWEEARNAFNAALEAAPDDGPSLTLLGRIEKLESNPPPSDWDGAWQMDHK